jgi:Pro-Pro endopeptidase
VEGMKKILKFSWIIIILISVIIISSIVVSVRNAERNRSVSKKYASLLVLPMEGDFDSFLEGVTERLSLVPAQYLKALYDKRIFIKSVNGSVTSVPEFYTNEYLKEKKAIYEDYAGIFIGNFIILRADERYGLGGEIHEVGHAVDYVLFDKASSSKEFNDIFKNEAEKFFNKPSDEYYKQDVLEYFAQTFFYYYWGYDTRRYLKERAPQTYKFIKTLESKKI